MNNTKSIFQILFSQTKDFVFFIIHSFLSVGFAHFDVIGGNHADTSWYVGLFIIGLIGFATTSILKSRTKTILTTNVTIKLAKDAYESVMNAEPIPTVVKNGVVIPLVEEEEEIPEDNTNTDNDNTNDGADTEESEKEESERDHSRTQSS